MIYSRSPRHGRLVNACRSALFLGHVPWRGHVPGRRRSHHRRRRRSDGTAGSQGARAPVRCGWKRIGIGLRRRARTLPCWTRPRAIAAWRRRSQDSRPPSCRVPQPNRFGSCWPSRRSQETVIVTATNTEAPASQIGASVTAFTADDMDRRRDPMVTDLLRTSPGAMVDSNRTFGGVASLFVRGGDSDDNKVLLDGIPLNEPGGTFNFGNLTTDNLEPVEDRARCAVGALRLGRDRRASCSSSRSRRSAPTRIRRHPPRSKADRSDTVNRRQPSPARRQVRLLARRLAASAPTTRRRTTRSTTRRYRRTSASSLARRDAARDWPRRDRTVGHAWTDGVRPPGPRPAFARHDGVGGVTFDQRSLAAFHQHIVYLTRRVECSFDHLVLDPPYTAQYQGHIAPFVSTDFTVQRRDESAPPLRELSGRLAPAARGRRRSSPDSCRRLERRTHSPRGSPRRSPTATRRATTSVPHSGAGARGAASSSPRAAGSSTTRASERPPCLAARSRVRARQRRRRGRDATPRERRPRHQGADGAASLQRRRRSFMGNPNLLPERSSSFDPGIEQRFADDHAKIEATWFDNRLRKPHIVDGSVTTISSPTAPTSDTHVRSGAEIGVEVAPSRRCHSKPATCIVDSDVRREHIARQRRPRQGELLLPAAEELRLCRSATLRVGRVSAN